MTLLLRLLSVFSLSFVSSPPIVANAAAEEKLRSASFSNLEENFHHDIDELTLAVGETHACALEHISDAEVGGEVVCWGSNDAGQADVPPAATSRQLAVAAGAAHSCSLSAEGDVRCWGSAASGQTSVPGAAASAQVAIAAGESHGCALSAVGSIACWGAGDAGQGLVPTAASGSHPK